MDLDQASSLLTRAASEGNYEELCEILKTSHFDKNTINQALYQAVSKSQSASEHLGCIEALIGSSGNSNYKDSNGVSLLMIAAKLGQIQLAELLINFGSSVEDKDKENRTPLMYAVESCYGDNVDVVKFLLEKKAKVSLQDNNGNSALHRSAERGYIDSMAILLDYGAFINAENKDKETPLHLACRHGFENCVELLLQKKASVYLKNSAGKVPVEIAPEQIRHVFESPQECASDSSFCSMSSQNEVMCRVCKRLVADVICKPCHDNNLQYNTQTFLDNNKTIEGHVKEISELKANNIEICKQLKIMTENCGRFKKVLEEREGEIMRKESEIAEGRGLKEQVLKRNEEICNLNNTVKEYEEEIESLKEQVINYRSEAKFQKSECDIVRKRLEECKSREGDGMYSIRRTQRKTPLSYLKPYPVPDKTGFMLTLREEITHFVQEIEKWQEEVDQIYVDLTTKIKRVIKKKFVSSSVELYGSYATRLHLPSSDIDMVITNLEGDKRDILRNVEKLLKSQLHVRNTNLIHQALVPVLKIRSEIMGRVVQIDITVNDTNHSGLKCLGVVTRLLQQNAMIRPIFIVLKELLYVCNFKEPFTGGLGSYSLFLMVSSFVQRQQEFCEKNKIENSIAEFLVSTLSNYADHTSYFGPILTTDPVNGGGAQQIHDREVFDSYIQLVVVDPLNGVNNVAYNTHVERLIHIFRTAYYNLKRVALCDCALACSPLYRMLYDTKENLNN